MWVVLPPLVLGLIWWGLPDESGRRRILHAALIWGVLVTVITEVTGVLHAFTLPGVLFAWGICAVGVVLMIMRQRAFPRPSGKVPRSFTAVVMLMGLGIIILITGLVALVAPPNTWDVLTYHMPRVMHWVQNQHVAHFPASDLRQLYQHPWAEFTIAHLQILSGGDRFANIVQWASMLGVMVGVSAVTKLLGGGMRTQLFAAVFAATLPAGILQASTAQNDLVVAFWGVCLVYGVVEAHQQGLTRTRAIMIGTALGLMLLTKATAYIYALPFGLWVVGLAWRDQRRSMLQPLVLIGVLVLALNAGHLSRNFAVFDSPLGPHDTVYRNSRLTLPVLLSNGVRNVAIHVVVPGSLRPTAETLLGDIYGLLGIDINDPISTYPDTTFALPTFNAHEDLAPAPLHMLLIIAAAVGLALQRRRYARTVIVYGLALLLVCLLFCAILKWQPWHVRLHVPVFVLAAPVVAIILGRWFQSRLIFPLAVILLLLAIYPLLWNATRPLIGENSILNADREAQLFAAVQELQPIYQEAVTVAVQDGCTDLGLGIGSRAEYPLWVLVKAHNSAITLRHILTPVLRDDTPPCAIIADSTISGEALRIGEIDYARVWQSDILAVLRPMDSG